MGKHDMIEQDIVLRAYNWHIKAFYNFTCNYTPEAINALQLIKCPKNSITEAVYNIMSCKLNKGLTFTNMSLQRSVIIVSESSSPSEFLNTLVHENHHLLSHIAEKYGISCGSEELSYLAGELISKQYDCIKNLIVQA